MAKQIDFNTVLVPVDFSAASEAAFQRALKLTAAEGCVVIVLHVIDASLVEFAVSHGFASHNEVVQRMRERARAQLGQYRRQEGSGGEVDTIVSEGTPFLEILQKAKDFAVDVIVMGDIGTRGRVEKLLFGSTAEKVLRGSDRPVLVLPLDD